MDKGPWAGDALGVGEERPRDKRGAEIGAVGERLTAPRRQWQRERVSVGSRPVSSPGLGVSEHGDVLGLVEPKSFPKPARSH